MSTWIPNVGYVTFGRQHVPDVPEFVPQHDPREPVNSPYYVAPPVVPEPAVEPVPEMTPGERAKAFLAAELADGEPVASVGLLERAVKAGITISTLRRIAKAMGLRKIKQGRGPWCWAMPEVEQ